MSEHDYIIVGGGSAGCVLARRLTEPPGAEVLLLEAGPSDDRREIQMPAAWGELFNTEVDWAYHTAPQPGLNGRALYWPRGKTLGGSSAINAQVAIRGHPSDYDRWAAQGNDGWSAEAVEPYFQKIEAARTPTSAEARDPGPAGWEARGTDGPLQVGPPPTRNPLTEAFLAACEERGLPRNRDFNAGRQEGVGAFELTQKNGRRHSAADAYLRPVLGRPSLTVRTGASVTRLQIEDRHATGVVYQHDGELKTARTREDVLLCAGAVGSPHLLMLSGIGPAAHLREHGIEVVADRPGVGRNLQDHLIGPLVYECARPVTYDDADTLWNLAKYLVLGRGPLTSNVVEAGGFVRTEPGLPAPDLQYYFAPAYVMRHGFDNPEEGHGFGFAASPLHPDSRGRLTLRSADPADAPQIDPQYGDRSSDLSALVDGLRRLRAIAHAGPFDEYRGAEVWPGSGATTDQELAGHLRRTATTAYHPVGTCRMGDGKHAVVDDRLRVRGVQGLRVADASIMPDLPGGNTNLPTMMIAEKAADWLRDAA
jgi:choline dehydrogenase